MPRFVILEHDHPVLHWDLMLECGDVLKTWRLAAAPVPDLPTRAEATSDHRLIYLDYEGPVSRGRGQVSRWDAGVYEEAIPGQLTGDVSIKFRLEGTRLHGQARLDPLGVNEWTLIFESFHRFTTPTLK
jgi:hypothetical protein